VFVRAFGLSARETELLTHLVAGSDTKTVAAEMFLSEHTVQGPPEVGLRQDRRPQPPHPARPRHRPLSDVPGGLTLSPPTRTLRTGTVMTITGPRGGDSRYWRVLRDERREFRRPARLVPHDLRNAVQAHPPQLRPVVVVVVDEQRGRRPLLQIAQALQLLAALGLVVDRCDNRVRLARRRSRATTCGGAVRPDRGQPRDARALDVLSLLRGHSLSLPSVADGSSVGRHRSNDAEGSRGHRHRHPNTTPVPPGRTCWSGRAARTAPGSAPWRASAQCRIQATRS
jgi:hypothetical protein